MSSLVAVNPAYRPSLDGLRGLAIIFVLIEHTFPNLLPFGYLGVDIFFVLSGYVVTLSLLRSSGDGKSSSFSKFFVRRFKRLAPVLYLTVFAFSFIYLLFVYPFSSEATASILTGIASMFGLSNIYLFFTNQDYFSILASHNLFLHTWSLGIEEQFYLTFPLIFFFVDNKKSLIFIVLSIAFLSYFLQMYFLNLPEAYNIAFYLPFSRIWQLLLGSFGALTLESFTSRLKYLGQRAINIFTLLLTLTIFYGVYTGYDHRLWITYTLISVNVFTLILFLEHNSFFKTLYQNSAIVFIGVRSYSIYLFHWPLLVISSWIFIRSPLLSVFSILLTLVLSTLSYRFLENPFRHSISLTKTKHIALIYFSFSTFVATLLYSLYAFSHKIFLGETTTDHDSSLTLFLPHRATAPVISNSSVTRDNCFKRFSFTNDVIINANDIYNCHLPPLYGTRTIYLYGDSFAAHLSPLLEKLHYQNGFGVEILVRARCPFPPRYDNVDDPCFKFFVQRRQHLLSSAKSGDVLFLATSAREPSGRYTESYLASLRSLVSTLRQKGVLVVYQDPLPRFPKTFDPVCTYPSQWFQVNRSEHCLSPSFVNRRSEINRLSILNSQLKLLSSQFSNFLILESFDYLCPPSSNDCSTNSPLGRLYRDGIHLSEYASQSLYSSFIKLLNTSPSHF